MAVTPLSKIRAGIKGNNELILDRETLGQAGADLFRELFNKQEEFRLTGCDVAEPDGTGRLTGRGAFQNLLSLDNVNVEFILFDRPSSGEATERHGVFSVSILDIPAVVSSLDGDGISYPEFGPEFPWAQIREGINFTVDIPALPNGRLAPLRHGLIRADGGVSYLELTGDLGGTAIGFSGLSLTPKKIGVALPLSPDDAIRPRIFLTGAITLGIRPLDVKPEFDPYHHELCLSIGNNFPTLQEVMESLAPGLKEYFLETPSGILTAELSKLSIVLNLADRSISEIGFELTTTQAIDLIPNVISLKPTLIMQIYAPFERDFRAVEGVLKGDWEFDKSITFKTELAYPSLSFSGTFTGEVSSANFVKRFLPGIDLPVLTFTTMEIEGNVREKSFSAVIEAEIRDKNDKTWGFSASGLTAIRLALTYANQQMSDCAVECTLTLAGVKLALSAQYDAGQEGLQFDGRTTEPIPIAELAKFLGATLPLILQNFTVKSLQISFNTHSRDFTFTCDGDLKIESSRIKATVTLDRRHEHGSVPTHFSGRITLGNGVGNGVEFALIFDEGAENKKALASYHNPNGQSQKILNLISPVSSDFAKLVPPSLKFALHDALLGYSDSKWLFGVDIEGGLNLSDVKLPDFPLLSRFAPSPDQTLKLAVQVVGANKPFTDVEVDALAALNPGGLKLPHQPINGLGLAASLRLGQESRQLSLPIGVKKDGPGGDNGLTPGGRPT